MKTMLAVVGGFVLALGFLGAFGIGNFVLIYTPDKITCTKDKEVK